LAVIYTSLLLSNGSTSPSRASTEQVRLSEILISTPQPYDPAQIAEAQHKAEQVRAASIDATNPNAVVLYIDGFNNPGFSGGPILYWSFSKRAYRILGVVKGYKEDTAKVLVNGEHVDTQLLVNSGILLGYSISHVIQAIESK
jgi:hypothetical protein